MKKTKYTVGFEKFWKVWIAITRNFNGKFMAFKYWKRDKLEGDEDELIKRLDLQQDERKRLKVRGEWQPQWCFCQKWLNNRRYEYVPELPKNRVRKIIPLTTEEKEIYSPEQVKKRAEYRKFVEESAERMDAKSILSKRSTSDKVNAQRELLSKR